MQRQTCCPDECPKRDDVYVCQDCKFSLVILKPCQCADCQCVALACCGKAMVKVN